MFAKASTIFAVFAVAARVAVAAPPACLLAAVNEHPNPADIKTICSEDASKVNSYISKNCGEHEDAATKFFKDVCEDNGAEYSGSSSNSTSSSSSTASHSGSKTASATGSLTTSSSGNSTDSDSPMITGASTFATGVSGAASASGTGAVGSDSANNGTVLSTAGTAGPTTAGNSGTSPTGSSDASESGTPSEGGAARMGFEAVGVAVFGVVGAMMVL